MTESQKDLRIVVKNKSEYKEILKMMNRDVVEAILVTKDNKVLLQKKTVDYPICPGGYWTFFGGEVEKSEHPIIALNRELKEEIDFKPKNFNQFAIKDYEIAGRVGKRFIYTVLFDGDLKDISLTEGAGFAFFEESELEDLKLVPLIKDTIKEYFKSIKKL